MNIQSIIILIVLIISMYQPPAYSQSSPESITDQMVSKPSSSIFNELERENILEITIKTDLTELLSGKGTKSYIPSQLSYEDQAGQDVSWTIEARQRGKYRRRVCEFPPLKLRFDKNDLANKGLSSFHTLKLVTHCLDDKYSGKTNVLKEYLTYQLYEELTNKSLKTQLVKVTYVDTKRQVSKIKRYGFIIENHHEMASRVDGNVCDCMNPDLEQMNKKQDQLVAMFNYMIGNEDFDIQMGRNLKLIQPNDGSPMFTVPYDFDFAGLINTEYAIPSQDLKLESVTDRFYQGYHKEKVEIEAMLDYFQLKKDNLYQIINDFKVLDSASRKQMINYLDEFFLEMEYLKIIGTDEILEVEIAK